MTYKWAAGDHDYTVVSVNDDEDIGVLLNSFLHIKIVELYEDEDVDFFFLRFWFVNSEHRNRYLVIHFSTVS